MTLISAPAGFGKTTLLAAWVASFEDLEFEAGMKPLFAWLSLDEGDNDPSRFLAYLLAALETIVPTEATLPSPTPQRMPPAIEQTLTAVINTLTRINAPLILILDDLHHVEQQPVHDALTFLVERQPPHLHLVIATRADPLLPLARLRARGQLLELRAADLRFTSDEAHLFLERVSGLALTAENIAALQARTEGWAAGLQLTALSLERQKDIAAFIAAFTGSHEYIADYLQTEVLNQQPAALQQFLLRTSILDQLTAPLCNALTEQSNGQQTLEQIKEKNLFLLALDNERCWYRYHSLFAELLRQRLQRLFPDLLPILHGRASAWYAQQDQLPEAIQHALAANNFVEAARLISAAADEMLLRGEITRFIAWVQQLPAELIRINSTLSIYYAWALWLNGQPLAKIEPWLPDGLSQPDAMPPQTLPLLAYINLLRGQEKEAAKLLGLALERLPEEEHFLRSIAHWLKTIADLQNVDLVASSEHLAGLAQQFPDARGQMVVVFALCNQAEILFTQGRLQAAQSIFRRALAAATDGQERPLPIAGAALIGLGGLAYEWNDLQGAEKELRAGITLIRQWSEIAALDGLVFLAQTRQALGDVDSAHDLLSEAAAIAARFDATEIDDWIVSLAQTRFTLQQGDLQKVRDWIKRRGLDKDTAEIVPQQTIMLADRLRKYELIILARLLLAEKRPADALAILEAVIPLIEQRGRTRFLIEALTLKAMAYEDRGAQSQALATLEKALQLAKPGAHVRIFIDEGYDMAQLLYQALASRHYARILWAFVGRIFRTITTG